MKRFISVFAATLSMILLFSSCNTPSPSGEASATHQTSSATATVSPSGEPVPSPSAPTSNIPSSFQDKITDTNYVYNLDKCVTPFWNSNIMYNECMAMVQEGSEIYGTLLFVPTKVVSVVDVTMKRKYVAGVDYEWVEGTNKIKWLKGSKIPYFFEGALLGLKEPGGTEYVKNFVSYEDGFDETGRSRLGGVLYTVDKFLYEKQLCVTYEYDMNQIQTQGILYSQCQKDKLPKTSQKLANKEKVNILFYGDSVFQGCDASGMYGRLPNMPTMSNLLRLTLTKKTGANININNIAVGGWTAQQGLDALTGTVAGKNYSNEYNNYDLLILHFGMNNPTVSPTAYKATIKKIIDQVRTKSPDIEVILMPSLVPNPEAKSFCGNQPLYGGVLKELAAEENCGVIDIYAIHEKILEYKNYISTSGNNINHPNDWLIRVYAQNIVSAII